LRHDDAAGGRRDVLLGRNPSPTGCRAAVHFFYWPPEQPAAAVFLPASQSDSPHQAVQVGSARRRDPRCRPQVGLTKISRSTRTVRNSAFSLNPQPNNSQLLDLFPSFPSSSLGTHLSSKFRFVFSRLASGSARPTIDLGRRHSDRCSKSKLSTLN